MGRQLAPAQIVSARVSSWHRAILFVSTTCGSILAFLTARPADDRWPDLIPRICIILSYWYILVVVVILCSLVFLLLLMLAIPCTVLIATVVAR